MVTYLISFLIVYIFYFIIKMVEPFRNLIPHLVEVRLEMTCIKRIQIYSFYWLVTPWAHDGRKLKAQEVQKTTERSFVRLTYIQFTSCAQG